MASINIIADKIILEHREMYGDSPTPMKLQKLCYYAQGFYLAENKGTSLFPEDFQAWRHGPVCPDLYHRFSALTWQPIADNTIAEPTLAADLVEHIKVIVGTFGSYDGAALSRMTHEERPWLEARKDLPEDASCTTVIKKETMTAYFAELLSESHGARERA